MTDPRPLHIFWDNSNIFISAKDAASKRWPMARSDVRIQFDNLYKLATAARPVREARAMGSVPPSSESVWRVFTKRTGIVPELYERGSASHKEQAVDQALQVWMLRAMADYAQTPGIAVLLSGDGAGFGGGGGFFADLKRLHAAGWGVELIAWEDATHGAMRSWVEEVGVFVPLDKYLNSITFVEGVRPSTILSLKGRRVAPALSEAGAPARECPTSAPRLKRIGASGQAEHRS